MSQPMVDPNSVEVMEGREREQLEGWIPALASDAEIREALEKAFDYRGDVTITLQRWHRRSRLCLRSPARLDSRRILRCA